jgi:hypothetical protein
MFALAGGLLQRSGAYMSVIAEGAPRESIATIRTIAQAWHSNVRGAVPPKVAKWWKTVVARKKTPIDEIGSVPELVAALLDLVAAADEASLGLGVAGTSKHGDADFEEAWLEILVDQNEGRSCSTFDVTRVVVLPKLHTPRSGITMRSLTHNLALYIPGEVVPHWHYFPRFEKRENLNLLLLPWPLEIDPASLRASSGTNIAMPDPFSFFTCELRKEGESIVAHAKEVFDRARKKAGVIDAILFPEAALVGDEYVDIARSTGALVIAGVGRHALPGVPGRNEAAVAMPASTYQLSWKQSKHHRWRIDGGQIRQYQLGLDEKREWWEDIKLGPRELNFLSLNDWLTISVLICEDLARLDPVSDLVRSVGPNLVVTLLLDGPQLSTRWPARYATVLADDPGSSVLTLTGAGMAARSKPLPGSKSMTKPGEQVIALWKDAKSAATSILLKPGSEGVILHLKRAYFEEWTADGRSDDGSTAYLLCTGYDQVKKA